jgi:taurine dehydrogenase small subunit
VTQIKSQRAAEIPADILDRFTGAWNDHDVDAVMELFDDDCSYLASFGPEKDGTAYRGRDEVRAGVVAYLANFPDGRYSDVQSFVSGSRGACQWTFAGTSQQTGERVEVRGCDLFEFANGKIRTKDAFRKERRDPLARPDQG